MPAFMLRTTELEPTWYASSYWLTDKPKKREIFQILWTFVSGKRYIRFMSSWLRFQGHTNLTPFGFNCRSKPGFNNNNYNRKRRPRYRTSATRNEFTRTVRLASSDSPGRVSVLHDTLSATDFANGDAFSRWFLLKFSFDKMLKSVFVES